MTILEQLPISAMMDDVINDGLRRRSSFPARTSGKAGSPSGTAGALYPQAVE
jgi:hypothetical protein